MTNDQLASFRHAENGHHGTDKDIIHRAQSDVVVKKLIDIFPDIAKNEVGSILSVCKS